VDVCGFMRGKTDDTELDHMVLAAVDGMPLSQEDKALIKASLWLAEEIPEIKDQQQYEAYKRKHDELVATLPDRQSPEFGPAFLQFSRSNDGKLATAYGARMIEWEERDGGSQL